MVTRVAIGNHKGGTGKTSVAVGLAAALAEAGRRVLVVDMDPQANASRRLAAAWDPEDPSVTVSEVILNSSRGIAAEAIRPCGWPQPYSDRVDVIPSRLDLDNRLGEAAQLTAVQRLALALADADDNYDVTLIDCQPSLAHLTQMALAAADVALAVMDPTYDGVAGAVTYREFVESDRNRLGLGNEHLRLAGVIVNRLRANVGAHQFQLDGLADLFGDLVWTPYLPERAAVLDSGDAAVPLATYGSGTSRQHAVLFADLAARLLKEIA